MLKEFIEFLESQVDKGLYVLGGQTQVIYQGIVYQNGSMQKSYGSLKTWISSIGQSGNYAKVKTLYDSRVKRWGDIPFRIFDCSGLGMAFLYNLKHIASSDMTANGMMGKCKMLKKSDLKKGDWVFRVYTSGSKKDRAYHIGYVVDNNLNVVEDKGKAYGVIRKAFDSKYWNAYGRPSYFAEEIEKEIEPTYTFTRVLKRVKPTMTGDDVKELQRLLNNANGANLAEDGKFGALTEKAVKNYQKAKGLVVDGKAGKNTITALGGKWGA